MMRRVCSVSLDPESTLILLQAEWTPVTEAVQGVAHCLRPGTTAGDFVADLMAQAVWVRNWWADRNAKAVPGALLHKFRECFTLHLLNQIQPFCLLFPA